MIFKSGQNCAHPYGACWRLCSHLNGQREAQCAAQRRHIDGALPARLTGGREHVVAAWQTPAWQLERGCDGGAQCGGARQGYPQRRGTKVAAALVLRQVRVGLQAMRADLQASAMQSVGSANKLS